MSDVLPLSLRPNLEPYKKLAQDLEDACKAGDCDKIRQWAARFVETLAPSAIEPQEAERIERRWHKFNETNERASRCALAGVRLFIAREHGFISWPRFARHVQAMARPNSPISMFEAAADAIIHGDTARLQKLLSDRPKLAQQLSTRDHRSTLLHYVSANGVEDFRQKTPTNIVEITKILLDAGSDVNAESDAYGGGCTALGLVATSVHPERSGAQIALLQTLLDRGSTFHQPSTGGHGHSIIGACLANGQPKAAEFFANLGAPLDLEGASALGRLDVVKSYFDASGDLRPQATWKQLESAFLYACGYGSAEVAGYLLERGIDPGLRNAEGRTGLHWAAYGAHVDVVKLLLHRGAPVHAQDERFQATPLDVELWERDHSSDTAKRERCHEVVALLQRIN